MPSPDLPQPIYPNAPTAQPPAPPAFYGAPGHGAPGGQLPPQGPGGWNAGPQQPFPTPPGGGAGRRTQILLAAGAAAVVAAVVLVIVLTTRSSDTPTGNTAGTGTQNTAGGNQVPPTGQGGNNGAGQGSGAGKAEIVSALSLTLGTGFQPSSYDCMADELIADPDLYTALNTTMTASDSSAFAGIVIGCSSVDERVETVATAMSLQNDATVVDCTVAVMYSWDESTWQWYFEGVLNPATQANMPTQAFGADCGQGF